MMTGSAIAAAATTSVPEGIGGAKNWDYRYAWIRDAGYSIKAFLRIGAWGEAKSAFTWLLKRLGDGQPQVCYTLEGEHVPPPQEIDVPGWRGSRPASARSTRASTCRIASGAIGRRASPIRARTATPSCGAHSP